jgi:hypothetical protein
MCRAKRRIEEKQSKQLTHSIDSRWGIPMGGDDSPKKMETQKRL